MDAKAINIVYISETIPEPLKKHLDAVFRMFPDLIVAVIVPEPLRKHFDTVKEAYDLESDILREDIDVMTNSLAFEISEIKKSTGKENKLRLIINNA
ncbi:MAG: hypothetical protein ACYCTD_04870 [bacterium]